MHKETAIKARGLTFAYSSRDSFISGLDLALGTGEATALAGPNGGGKTTLGKLLTGIIKPSAGELFHFGEDALQLPLSRIGQKVGYCFQNPNQQLLAASVEEEIAFGLKYRGASREHIEHTTESLLSLFEISHLRQSFPLNLSWGEKRRLVLAACLALEPKYLVLDEPTVGLDGERIKILSRILSRLLDNGIGMLFISHDQDFIQENAQRILHMQRGEIVDDRYC